MNKLNKWKVENSNEATHLLLTGGKLRIKEHDFNEFINVYAKLMKKNEDISLVERVSDKIRLFIDIDSKQNENLQSVVDDILQIFPIDHTLYHCNQKNGIHIIFPGIITTPCEAKEMILKLQQKLITVYKYEEKFIKNVIDTSVYSTGLRMIGSYKSGEKRCYLKKKSCRTKLTKFDIEESLIRASFSNYQKQPSGSSLHINDTNCNSKIEKEIERLNDNYEGIKVRSIRKINNLYSISTNSKYCMNLNNTHKSHFVYFVVNEKKMLSQKCFCRCDTLENRLHGLCSKYKSEGVPISHMAFHSLSQLC